jgi:regulator of replication initiation timing
MPELVVTQEPTIISVSATQEPVTKNNEDNDDVPLAQLFSQIEKKIKGTENSRITELMKENDSLKAELDSLKKELQVARQKNSEESTLDILAQATTIMNENREHMCYECGNIYFQAGYKIVKVPVTGHTEEPTNFSVKTEYDLTAPQEPVRQKRSQGNRLVVGLPTSFTQEPLLHLQVVTQATQTDYVLEDKETQTDF